MAETDLLIPTTPFHLQILENCKKYGNAIALTDTTTGRTLTFTEVLDESLRIGTTLKRLGIGKGDSILLALPNCAEYPLIFLGACLNGAIVSGVSPDLTKDEILQYAVRCKAKLIICDDLAWKRLGDVRQILVSDVFGPPTVPLHPMSLSEFVAKTSIGPEDVLLAPFSSGTTDTPKCVHLTHDNYNAETASLKRAVFDSFGEEKRTTLALLSFYHGSGFWALVFCLLEGHHTVIMRQFNLGYMLGYIEKYKIEIINVVPSIITALARAPPECELDSVTTVLCGSAPLGKELCEVFLERFKSVTSLIQGYGMTEVVILSHTTPVGEKLCEEKLGSCGKLLPGFEAKIVDEDGAIVPTGERGELLLKGRSVMKGYLGAPSPLDSDGWLRTGDIAYVDVDGYYYIVDRIKEVFKVHGMQVAPAEIEDVLLSSPLVKGAAVIGIPDEWAGSVPRAYVVLADGATADDLPTIAALKQEGDSFKERLASFKHLKGGLFILDELPLSSSGKVLRRELLMRVLEDTML